MVNKPLLFTIIAVAVLLLASLGIYTGFSVKESDEVKLPVSLCKNLVPKLSGITPTIVSSSNSDILGVVKDVDNSKVLSCEFSYMGEVYTRYPNKVTTGKIVVFEDISDDSSFSNSFYSFLGSNVFTKGTVESVYLVGANSNDLMKVLYFVYPGNYRTTLIYGGGIGSSNNPEFEEGSVIWKSSKFYKPSLLSTPKPIKNLRYVLSVNLDGDLSEYRLSTFVVQNLVKFYEPDANTPNKGKDYRYLTFSP